MNTRFFFERTTVLTHKVRRNHLVFTVCN